MKKKLTVLFALVGLVMISIGAYMALSPSISAATSTTSIPITTIPVTTTGTDTYPDNGKVYYYTDYNDLVNQIYQDVYKQVYDQVYQDVVNQLTSDYYDQIYQNVQAKLNDALANDQIDVYVGALQSQIHAVVSTATQSVIGVEVLKDGIPQDLGSGVIFNYDSTSGTYSLITNNHVVEPGNQYRIVFSDGSYVNGTLLGVDTVVDIAVITFSNADFQALNNGLTLEVSPLGDSSTLTTGELVLAVGMPQGFDFYDSVTLGIVSGLNRNVESNEYVKYIQHDAGINEGNSGGPIYNLQGNVVGINVSKLVDTSIEGMGFSIPINTIKEVINRIESDANYSNYNTIAPRLGADVYDITNYISGDHVTLPEIKIGFSPQQNVSIKLPSGITTGLAIYNIDSSLMLGGTSLHEGDLIYSIDGHVIQNAKDFYDYLYANYSSGDTVTLKYYTFNTITYSYNSTMSTTPVLTLK